MQEAKSFKQSFERTLEKRLNALWIASAELRAIGKRDAETKVVDWIELD